MKTGVELIAEERDRQISEEGWSLEHDTQHRRSELAIAAAAYALPVSVVHADGSEWVSYREELWPWASNWWKPSPGNRIKELVKAGALIAAQIDLLQKPDRDILDEENEFVKFLESEIGCSWRDLEDGLFDYKEFAMRIKDKLSISKKE